MVHIWFREIEILTVKQSKFSNWKERNEDAAWA